ncbi:MAG TPA: dTDP-4-dehydrorhamnose 3,5-epimerase [Bacteroidales bacterium]|nr:dTDP-4-dehydrorhamnose 3,5-epimerase [Bacteroidales bacterium]
MKLIETGISGLFVLEPKVFKDDRGYFFESYNSQKLSDLGIKNAFVQDNQSKSSYGVLRGLHYQLNPHAQTKLVRVLDGIIYDVAVDIRKGSPTFGKHFGIELSSENNLQLYIPKGFAHGFSVLSNTAVVMYKCDSLYNPQSERGVRFDDPALDIDWHIPVKDAILSPKDTANPLLKDAEINFTL